MKMSSCCWGSRRVCVGGYPLPAIAGRTCCWGSGGGTPPDQLLADAAVGVRGGVPPLNQELPGASNYEIFFSPLFSPAAPYKDVQESGRKQPAADHTPLL